MVYFLAASIGAIGFYLFGYGFAYGVDGNKVFGTDSLPCKIATAERTHLGSLSSPL